MELSEKVEQATSVIRSWASQGDTVVLSSFGKDSMVLLDLVKKADLNLPILFMREPFFPEKYEFANEQILKNGYTVYDYRPLGTGLVYNPNPKGPHDKFEVANMYQVGTPDQYLYLPTGVSAPEEGKPFLCGLYDLLNKPVGTFKFPWNVVLIGHKSSDSDPFLGELPLKDFVATTPPVVTVFPILEFTDEDIWAYHEQQGLPVHSTRYADGEELEDKSKNPDYFPACMECVDPSAPHTVYCPRVGAKTPNLSSVIRPVRVLRPSYVKD